MHYHLTQTNRIELSLLRRLGYSVRQVASQLGFAASTVSRELRRNAQANGKHHATSARVAARSRREAANALRAKLLQVLRQHRSSASLLFPCATNKP
jgi:IS30 family transposase